MQRLCEARDEEADAAHADADRGEDGGAKELRRQERGGGAAALEVAQDGERVAQAREQEEEAGELLKVVERLRPVALVLAARLGRLEKTQPEDHRERGGAVHVDPQDAVVWRKRHGLTPNSGFRLLHCTPN